MNGKIVLVGLALLFFGIATQAFPQEGDIIGEGMLLAVNPETVPLGCQLDYARINLFSVRLEYSLSCLDIEPIEDENGDITTFLVMRTPRVYSFSIVDELACIVLSGQQHCFDVRRQIVIEGHLSFVANQREKLANLQAVVLAQGLDLDLGLTDEELNP